MLGYLDLPSGLSGDMLLSCLIDCGWPPAQLQDTIERLRLPTDQWAIQVQNVLKGPLRATRVDVLVEEGRHHRRLDDIRTIINAADLSNHVKDRAIAVFVRLANAEAKVHGTTPDQIHFHEVGALDAIIDIVGGIAGLEQLGISTLYASGVPLGHGWTDTAHGRLPLPAPATLELLAAAGAPTRPAPGPGELLTPTAAAILAEIAVFEQPTMKLLRVGIGAGQKDFAWPNIARLWLGESQSSGSMVQLETNIDDMNPQLFAAVSERLFAAGAKDVWLTPVQMKKNRPGIVLSVLGLATDEALLAQIMLRETTTLGVRVHELKVRHEAHREFREVQTTFGTIHAKLKWLGSELLGAMPEYEDCREAAEKGNVPVRAVYEAAMAACQSLVAGLSLHGAAQDLKTGGDDGGGGGGQ